MYLVLSFKETNMEHDIGMKIAGKELWLAKDGSIEDVSDQIEN